MPTKESPRVTHSHPHAKIHTHTLTRICRGGFLRKREQRGCSGNTNVSSRDISEEIGCKISKKHFLSAARSADVRSQNLRRMHSCSLFARLCVYFLFAPSLMPLSTEPWIAPLCLQPPIWRRSPPRAHTHALIADEGGWIKKDFSLPWRSSIPSSYAPLTGAIYSRRVKWNLGKIAFLLTERGISTPGKVAKCAFLQIRTFKKLASYTLRFFCFKSIGQKSANNKV